MQAGKWVVLQTIWPNTAFGSAQRRAQVTFINQYLRDYARATTGPLILIDPWRSLALPSGTTGQINSALYDNTGALPNQGGAYYVGKLIATALSQAFPAISNAYPGAIDFYDAGNGDVAGNLLPNPAFLTATGGTNASFSGNMPANWSLIKDSGSAAATAVSVSTTAFATGFNARPGDKLNIVVNIPGGNTNNEAFHIVATPTVLATIQPVRPMALTPSLFITTGYKTPAITILCTARLRMSW